MTDSELAWRVQRFDELTREQLYAILGARVAVFVVEQDCPYQDVDGLDPGALHVTAWARTGAVAAYARIVPPGGRFAEPSIGRVLTSESVRRTGLGPVLMERAIEATLRAYPGRAIRISAQQYLERFYRRFGFATVSEPYPEDGIAHVEMLMRAGSEQ